MTQSLGTVLVLNYNADERASYCDALTAAGFAVIVSVDPLDALRVAVSHRPAAVVTRMAHPNASINGVEFITRLKADARTASSFIAVTLSLPEARHIREAQHAGADACLLLPASAAVVADTIKQALDQAHETANVRLAEEQKVAELGIEPATPGDPCGI